MIKVITNFQFLGILLLRIRIHAYLSEFYGKFEISGALTYSYLQTSFYIKNKNTIGHL